MNTLTCYACGEPGTTDEHVPPQCLFPSAKDVEDGSDLRRNLITVRSCLEHNLKKSGDDEYLLYVLTMCMPTSGVGQTQFRTKVARAIRRRPSLAMHLLSGAAPVVLENPATAERIETLKVPIDGKRFFQILKSISLAIYYHHFKSRWMGPVRTHAEFLPFADDPQETVWNDAIAEVSGILNLLFRNTPHHGENPEVFTYQVVSVEGPVSAVMRFNFYGESKAFVYFGAHDG